MTPAFDDLELWFFIGGWTGMALAALVIGAVYLRRRARLRRR